jgi:hypothetical protein
LGYQTNTNRAGKKYPGAGGAAPGLLEEVNRYKNYRFIEFSKPPHSPKTRYSVNLRITRFTLLRVLEASMENFIKAIKINQLESRRRFWWVAKVHVGEQL